MGLLIEVDLARRSAWSFSDQQLAILTSDCERLRPSASTPGLCDSDAHHFLNQMLLSPAAGPHSLRTTQRVMDVAARYIGLVYDARLLGPDEPCRRHRILVDAARSRRGPAIERALSAHLRENLSYIKSRLTADLFGS